MRRTVAVAVLVPVIGLGGAVGASGSPGMHAVHHLPLYRTGVGSKSLGSFAIHRRWVWAKASCIGPSTSEEPSNFEIDFVIHDSTGTTTLGMGAVCRDGSDPVRDPAVYAGLNVGDFARRAQIEVIAPAGLKWWIKLVNRPPKR